MASQPVQGFSLFPAAVPKISIPNPQNHKRTPSLHRVSMVTPADSALSPNGESIMIKIEEQPPIPQFPSHMQDSRNSSRTPSPDDIGLAVTTSSPIDGKTPATGSGQVVTSVAAVKYTPSIYQSSSPQPSFNAATGSASNLIQNAAPMSTTKSPLGTDPSPIVPIRSIFPTYNPSTLPQLNHAPKRPTPAQLASSLSFGASRDDYRTSLAVPMLSQAPKSTPGSVFNFPMDTLSVNGTTRISNHRELEKLWQASHGAEPEARISTFDLEMARIDEATFVIGAHPSLPFYTLQTYDTNEIAVSKTNPRKSTQTHDVVLCPLEPNSRRLPPNDGLVAFIFPKLAAMLAINQSAALALEHNLAPTDRDDVEAKAVRRAAKQEACSLRFNARGGFYELEHPAIGRGAMGGDFATASPVVTSPTTIRSMTGKPVLHITVTTESPLPIITVSDPNAVRRTGGMPAPLPFTSMSPVTSPPPSAGLALRRLSTVPQTDSPSSDGQNLASLDLTTETLHLDANAILELMPSLFSIDCIVTAILAVAVADAKTNSTLGAMDIWKPRPAPPSRLGTIPPSRFGNGPSTTRPGSVRSYAGSTFYATIAEREEAEEEARLMRRIHESDVRNANGRAKAKGKDKGKSRTWFGRKQASMDSTTDGETEAEAETDFEKSTSKSTRSKRGRKKEKNKKKKVLMTEFDLEKLGHYQSGDRKGQELPPLTRNVLGLLVMGLRLVVWLLSMLVQFLAWLLVTGTRCFTSEKF
ncbi:hypothetical protein PV10_00800 [Exophiala mesophila]|uniref:Uncharacterized protein n=1 Tax=Exophiala mesophila TaxID=212818 RepID=A0A0D1X5A1_EXOME|nr:uncharacterized protein PV10_00800 [Exophiala mesophila]KIV96990.1 hypothetical protein PV10_00800 [Exophiala mesophila]